MAISWLLYTNLQNETQCIGFFTPTYKTKNILGEKNRKINKPGVWVGVRVGWDIYWALKSSIVNTPGHVKCISFNNQCKTQPTLINLHPNECIEGLHYYPFAVNLDRCMGSFNTLNDLFNKVCVPNKIEDISLSVFNSRNK